MNTITELAIHSQASAMYQAHGIAAAGLLSETMYVPETEAIALAKAARNKGMLIGVCATAGVVACVAIGVGIYNHVKKKKSQEESK